jgi:ribosome-binding protein aMBF1 (putative translation factor)
MAWNVEYTEVFDEWWGGLNEGEQIDIEKERTTDMSTKPYKLLREKMSPKARAAAAKKTRELLAELPLQELRHVRMLSQEQLAEKLNVKQATVSKLERRADMYISTLRNVIKAMGGELEIKAKFPDGEVRINQFTDTDLHRRLKTTG